MNAQTRKLTSRIARAFNRIDDRLQSTLQGAEADAGFDAGEWSGPAHWRSFQKDADQIARSLGFLGVEALAASSRAVRMPFTYELHCLTQAAIEDNY